MRRSTQEHCWSLSSAKSCVSSSSRGLVHVISTDTHSPDKRPPRMAQGVQRLEELLGKETAARIVRNGDELFHDQELDAVTLHQPKKFLGMWV